MAVELQQAVDAGELCIGLNKKIYMLFASSLISYAPFAVSTRTKALESQHIYPI